MTKAQAIKKAKAMDKKHGREFYVIREEGDYHVADDYDLETFFLGVRDEDIVFCTID